MKVIRWISLGLAGAIAGSLVLPTAAPGWMLLGHSLNATVRDFRAYNDFLASENQNQTPDANFPGAVGAPLAIWKAGTEWASFLHNGTGAGDPTQTFPGGLGSAGANFDFVWLGEAVTDPDGGMPGTPTDPNDKIVHRVAPPNPYPPGVIAITLPGGGMGNLGWHIECVPDLVWFDGPGTLTTLDPRFDIQGIVTHELGHALGLAHDTIQPTATMFPGTTNGLPSVTLRSIESDDITGIRVLYGIKAPTKPRILGFQGILAAQQPLTIFGQNFGATGNEVWFNDGGADKNPVKILNVASTNGGTQLTVVPPCTVKNGDVFVKVGASTSGSTLSNGMPITFQNANGTPCIQCIQSVTPSMPPVLAVPQTELVVVHPTGGIVTQSCLPQNPLCPTPAQYSTVTEVQVGSVVLGPGEFLLVSDSEIRVPLPLFTTTGPQSVKLVNAGGTSCGFTITLQPSSTAVLETGPTLQLPGSTFTATMAAPLGFQHVLIFSASNVPSILPGIVSLGIGDNFAALNFIPTPLPNAAGVSQVSFPIAPIPGGGTVYFQMVAVNVNNPFGSLPLPASGVRTVVIP